MSVKYSAKNERIKREYFDFLKEAKQQDEQSIDAVAKALARFEGYNNHKEFKNFHKQQAISFKQKLAEQVSETTGVRLSKSTLHSTSRHLKNFFQWLSMQTGYKSCIKYSDADYFNISAKDSRIARAKRPQRVPSIEDIKLVIESMPAKSAIERRDRALIAFTLLTGVRDAAIASLKIKHVDFDKNEVFQDAREVNTKASKTITTLFFPVDDLFRGVVLDWVEYLREELNFDDNAPLFPKTRSHLSSNGEASASILIPEHWADATPIRKAFRRGFEGIDLPYANPHSFRNTLAKLGEELCKNAEDFKAWSQNLGHESVLTTFYSYGEVQPERQAQIIQRLKEPDTMMLNNTDEIAKALLKAMVKQGVVSSGS